MAWSRRSSPAWRASLADGDRPRNSTFAYKGKSRDVRNVGRELGVRYVVEGSVRKAGGNVRITAQLIEAETGGQLWAERFTGPLDDVFDLQDQITAGVVAAMEPSVRKAEIERAKRKRPHNLDAYDLYLRALEQSYTFTAAGRSAGLSLLDAAIALDPDYAEAHGVAAFCLQQRYLWGGRSPADREAALRHAEAVAALRTDDATALALAALALSALGARHDVALVMVPAFEAAAAERLIGPPEVWVRVRRLLAANLLKDVRRANAYLPNKEQLNEKALERASADPARYLAGEKSKIPSRATHELLLYGVIRLARTKPEEAAAQLKAHAGVLGADDTRYGCAQIGQAAAMQHHPRALKWFAEAGDGPFTAGQLQWMARAALRAGDWDAVRAAINLMPPDLARDPA